MEYRYLKERGALNEAAQVALDRPATLPTALLNVPTAVITLIPGSVARDNTILPLALDGETLAVAAIRADSIELIDKLTFIVNKKVRLVAFPREQIRAAIAHHYTGRAETESVVSLLQELTDTSIRYAEDDELCLAESLESEVSQYGGERTKARRADILRAPFAAGAAPTVRYGEDPTRPLGGSSMFYHVVEEGQRVLM